MVQSKTIELGKETLWADFELNIELSSGTVMI